MVDANQLADGHRETSRVCVVGAGPAGLVVATELAARGLRVCVVESGGRTPLTSDPLLEGRVVGMPYHLARSRSRAVGGTAHMWDLETRTAFLGARFRPLDPADFEVRSWVPDSGWPFGRETLDDYYRAVHELFNGGPWQFDDPSPAGHDADGPLSSFQPIVFQLASAGPFTHGLVSTLASMPTCSLLYDATVTELVPNPMGSAIESVRLTTSGGRRISVEAEVFVLAAGGVETPRLMLLSTSRSGGGVGNGHDLVGRYFMEHPHITSGFVVADGDVDPRLERLRFLDYQQTRLEFRYALRPEIEQRHGLGRLSVGLSIPLQSEARALRRSSPVPARWSGAYILRGLRTGSVPPQFGRHLWMILKGLPSLLDRGDEAYLRYLAADRIMGLAVMSEQVPNPASRVGLGRKRDRLGRLEAQLDWRLSGQDVQTLKLAQQLLVRELEPLGLRLMHDAVSHLDSRLPSGRPYGGGYHHMGTTRMHASPRSGVVDPNCQVHGVANLFVAGSSVFPTSGYANPTMTILALALRLVDHLEKRFGPARL